MSQKHFSEKLEIQYIKKRKDFGRQLLFSSVAGHMVDSIYPNRADQVNYGLRNPVHQFSQATLSQSVNFMNTNKVCTKNTGINHAEGGWPKDIHFYDEEATARLIKREERGEHYVNAIMDNYPKLERFLKQNNGIDMYQMYFKEIPFETPVEKSEVRFNNSYADPHKRPVSCLAWTFETDSKLVASYCHKRFPVVGPLNKILTCYGWSLENSETPSFEFVPPSPCWQVACSPASSFELVGGLEDGRVCLFDLRVKKESINISPMHLAHRDPVSSLLFIPSRLNVDFFSGSTDGSCIWWDIRNMSNPTDVLVMSARIPTEENASVANSEGVSCLQFERSFPTRFLCGTDTGLVINVNRKGKTVKEIFSSVYYAHKGPVKAIHRSPCTSKMFITCGDWTAHIWSDDVQSSPIVTGIPHRYQVNDVGWAPKRVSSYMTVGADGKFLYWDLLRKYHEPVIKLSVSKSSLIKLKAHDDGRLIGLGDTNGVLYVISISDNLVASVGNEKQLMLQTYERETHREHILESRVKEIRLKLKAEETSVPSDDVEKVDEEALVKTAEDEYKRIVMDEWRKLGSEGRPSTSSNMRNR